MNVYRWKFEITDHTKAICYTEGTILHEIVINDQPVSLEEAKDQSISLIKMTAYKDVLSTAWSHLEAAVYGVTNQEWLDKKLLDAARKRWGAKGYLAEMWLLAGQAYLETSLDFLEIIDDLNLKNKIANLLAQPSGVHQFINWLSLRTNTTDFTISSWWNNIQYVELDATFIQHRSSNHREAAIFLQSDGGWVFVMPPENSYDQVKFAVTAEPPSATTVLTMYPETELDTALELTTM